MKACSILFFLLFFSDLVKGQDSVNRTFKRVIKEARFKISEEDTCKVAIQNGLVDINANSIKYIRYGHTGAWPVEFLAQELLIKYNIRISFPGCVATNYMECYNKTVEPYVLQRFSKSIDDIIEEEIFNYRTSIGYRDAAYIGGKQKLRYDLGCLLKGRSIDYFRFSLSIDKDGRVNEFSGDTSRFTQPQIRVIKEAINQLKFYPALKKYETIEGNFSLVYSSFDSKGIKCR